MPGIEGFGFGRVTRGIYDKWPKNESGEPVCPAKLTHCQCSDMADELLVNMLEAYGIPAVCVHPDNGDLGEVILGMSGTGTDIYVPETLLEDAKALMEATPDEQLQS